MVKIILIICVIPSHNIYICVCVCVCVYKCYISNKYLWFTIKIFDESPKIRNVHDSYDNYNSNTVDVVFW